MLYVDILAMFLDNAAFLSALVEFYSTENSTVKIQLKKHPGIEAARKKKPVVGGESFCFVRASAAGKSISSIVSNAKAADFQNRLASILRANLPNCVKQES